MPAQIRRQFLSGGGDDPATSTPGMSDPPPSDPNPTSGPEGPGGSDGPPSNGNPTSGSGPGGGGVPTNTGGPPGNSPSGPSTGDGGSGANPTNGVDGSPGGNVFGPHEVRRGLSPAAITAIILAILLVLAILAVAARILWRRRLERRPSYHTEPVDMATQPEGASQTSFDWNPQMAERLRGGVIEPYNGSDSGESLSAQYRIEPFAVPPIPTRPAHVRSSSTMRLLDDAAAFGLVDEPGPSTGFAARRSEKLPRHPSASGAALLPPPPRGALNLPRHRAAEFAQSTGSTPTGTPMSESDIVFELPPTYASLAPPRPVRRWYQLWPQSDRDSGQATEGHSRRSGSAGSGQATEGHGGRSGRRSGSGTSGRATEGHGSASRSGSL